ncbi:MAG: hypothetical protein U5K79_14365 [Cyclobacteriaceae bacterium]|nr:hypothetical protein [Cyclobacteriaceae bacterium]
MVRLTELDLKNAENSDGFFMEKPWYLVDGRLTGDEAAVLAISPLKIYFRIEIFQYLQINSLASLTLLMIRSGLVVVYTDGEAPGENFLNLFLHAFLTQGLNKNTEFELARGKYISKKPMKTHRFRSPVYWNWHILI